MLFLLLLSHHNNRLLSVSAVFALRHNDIIQHGAMAQLNAPTAVMKRTYDIFAADNDDVFKVPPYQWDNPEIEPKPDVVIYQPCFHSLTTYCSQVSERLCKVLRVSTYLSNSTRALLLVGMECQKEKSSGRVFFAVAGVMGSGMLAQSCCETKD